MAGRDPNKNPWYLLATAYGELETLTGITPTPSRENRRIWNGWAGKNLSEKSKQTLVRELGGQLKNDKRPDSDPTKFGIEEFNPWSDAEREIVIKRFEGQGLSKDDIPVLGQGIALGAIDFGNTEFSKCLCMKQYYLVTGIIARGAVFKGNAVFANTVTRVFTNFDGAEFRSHAYFSNSRLGFRLYEELSLFNHDGGCASFKGTKFEGEAWFEVATLPSTDFSHAVFKLDAKFRGAHFTNEPPKFRYAKFGSGIKFTLDYDKWPDVSYLAEDSRGVDAPDDWQSAYRWLANLTDGHKLPEEVHFFVRQEFRCRQAIKRKWMPSLAGFYSCLSDYGHSVGRPIAWLALLWLIGFIAFGHSFSTGLPAKPGLIFPTPYWAGLGYSFANLFPLFGFGNAFFVEGLSKALPVCLKILSAAQTIFSLPLIFLFGLGLRNRFRLR